MDLAQLSVVCSDEDAAREYLERRRWPEGPFCPHCGAKEPYKLNPKPTSKRPVRKGVYKCRKCRKQFTATVGTIFEDSHIPIRKWLMAIHLLCASKKGMSAHQLHRMLGITYKSAWFMAHRIRYAMGQPPLQGKLTGIVEVDESYVGGKPGKNRHRPVKEKVPIVALVERGGRVKSMPVDRVTSHNLRKVLNEEVSPEAHLMTDESSVYNLIGRDFASHETVVHSRGEYARGNAHVNTAEAYFSILKRGVNGVYHHVSRDHLPRYLDEFDFRYNARELNDDVRADLAIQGAEGKRLMFKQPRNP